MTFIEELQKRLPEGHPDLQFFAGLQQVVQAWLDKSYPEPVDVGKEGTTNPLLTESITLLGLGNRIENRLGYPHKKYPMRSIGQLMAVNGSKKEVCDVRNYLGNKSQEEIDSSLIHYLCELADTHGWDQVKKWETEV